MFDFFVAVLRITGTALLNAELNVDAVAFLQFTELA